MVWYRWVSHNDDVMTRDRFLCYRSFVRGIKGQWWWALMFIFMRAEQTVKLLVISITMMLLWCHCNADAEAIAWLPKCQRCQPWRIAVHLHRTRQAAWLAHDMLQCDLLHSYSIHMVGSCPSRLLYILCISSFWGRCSSKKSARDSLCHAAIKFQN